MERCVLHFPEKNEFTDFLGELSQITFLKSEDIIEENERNILKTFYRNNDKPFLVCYQLWLKFCHKFFYLEISTIKCEIIFELNQVQTL